MTLAQQLFIGLSKSQIQMLLDRLPPHIIYQSDISIDGDCWSVLWGMNIQDGVAGFGKSPAAAMAEFDKAWYARLPDAQKMETPKVHVPAGECWPTPRQYMESRAAKANKTKLDQDREMWEKRCGPDHRLAVDGDWPVANDWEVWDNEGWRSVSEYGNSTLTLKFHYRIPLSGEDMLSAFKEPEWELVSPDDDDRIDETYQEWDPSKKTWITVATTRIAYAVDGLINRVSLRRPKQ